MTDDGQHGLSVTTKVFRILGAFSADCPRLRASDVCRRSGLPFSTVHRLLTELVTQGVLEHGADGAYTVGIKLWEVAALNPHLASLRGVATPWMHELRSMLRGNVHLDVRVGADGLCVEGLNGVHVDTAHHRLGARFPLRSAAGGFVLMAYAGSQTLEAVLSAPTTRDVRETVDCPHGLRQALAGIRRSGVAVSEGRNHLSVASPVFGPDGDIVAALELDVPAPGSPLRIAAAVRHAGSEISGTLRRDHWSLGTGPLPARAERHQLTSRLLPIQWVPTGQRQESTQDS